MNLKTKVWELNQECPWVISGGYPCSSQSTFNHTALDSKTCKISIIIQVLHMRKPRLTEIKEIAGFTQLINGRVTSVSVSDIGISILIQIS